MQLLFSYKGGEGDDLNPSLRFLDQSLKNMYELYLLLISLLPEIQIKAEEYLEKAKKKHLATEEDKNPNTKFTNNSILLQIKSNKALQEELENRKLNNWKSDDEYVDLLFKEVISSSYYENYMSSTKNSFFEDKEFIINMFKEIVAPNEKLYEYIESKKLTWIDDLPLVNTVILKLLRKIKPNSSESIYLPPLYRDEEDQKFGKDLFTKTVLNGNEFTEYISEKTKNWDSDRIASIDMVLLKMAVCEFQKFPSIPVKVTINEYLEIAKEYSTPKSSIFINGILDKLVDTFREDGKLNKIGRGLM